MRKTKSVHGKKSTPPTSSKRAKLAAKKSHSFKGLDNTQDIDLIITKQKLFQDIVGFSNERIGTLFVHAVQLLQAHRYDDAIKAAELLTQLNPFVADFWLCLGMAEQANGAFKRAREAFLTAQTMDPFRSEPYAGAIDCSLDLNDPLQAEVIYNQAMKCAKKRPKDMESKLLLKELNLRQPSIEREVQRLQKVKNEK